MALIVKFAVFGGLKGGSQSGSEAETVVAQLQQAIDASATGAVQISTAVLGVDPASGVLKHFAAIVEVDGTNYYFACQENQTINFNVGGSSGLTVKQAVFGGLKDGSPAAPEAGDVVGRLQWQINKSNGVVNISPANLGDPAPGVPKHFAAIVERADGTDYYFACQENQTIDFNKGA